MVENVHDLILDTVIAQPVPNGLNETAVVLKAVDGLLERNFVT
jgi:hypothetical protein